MKLPIRFLAPLAIVLALGCNRSKPAENQSGADDNAQTSTDTADPSDAQADAPADDGDTAPAGPAEEWQEVEAGPCLDAYSACLESLSEEDKKKLWMPYEQLQSGIEMMRKMSDQATIKQTCNAQMKMFRGNNLCGDQRAPGQKTIGDSM